MEKTRSIKKDFLYRYLIEQCLSLVCLDQLLSLNTPRELAGLKAASEAFSDSQRGTCFELEASLRIGKESPQSRRDWCSSLKNANECEGCWLPRRAFCVLVDTGGHDGVDDEFVGGA